MLNHCNERKEMKKYVYIVFGVLLFVGCTADLNDQTVSMGGATTSEKILNDSEGAIQGSILVRFGASAESRLAECATRSGATRTGIEGVDVVLDGVKGYAVEQVFMVTEKNRAKVYERGLHRWYELRFDESCDLNSVAEELAKVAEVERVQFSAEVCRVGNPSIGAASKLNVNGAATRAKVSSLPYDDTYARFQWSLNNLGAQSEVSIDKDIPTAIGPEAPRAGADINIVPAWKLCKGDPSIIVAVVDEGVMYSHEDLAANMWVNSGEIANDWIDNDGNGYSDDVYGLNCNRLDGSISWDKNGDSGHGSHVAGIVSAVNNNGKGICGIAGGDGDNGGVKIMSIQIFVGNGGATTANVAKGMQYAADHGAHIMQCSWGYNSYLASSNKGPSNDSSYKRTYRLEANAIDYFIANGGDESGPMKGGLAIFAAGNEGVALPGYPAAYEPCIAVASSNPAYKPSYYTCYGEGTDIIAPGGESFYINGAIFSTVPDQFSDPSVKGYALMQGTSQACPHVSGIAALGLSYAKQLGKHYTAEEFRSMLLSATNDIEPYLTGSFSAPAYGINLDYSDYKGKLGAGHIDAYKLLLQIDGTPYTVIKTGGADIDLAPFFGDGVYNAQLQQIEISDDDKSAIGLGDCTYSAGKLRVNCLKSGVATFKVTLLVGGGSLNNSNRPFPTAVTKSFVVMSKSSVSSNGGWL